MKPFKDEEESYKATDGYIITEKPRWWRPGSTSSAARSIITTSLFTSGILFAIFIWIYAPLRLISQPTPIFITTATATVTTTVSAPPSNLSTIEHWTLKANHEKACSGSSAQDAGSGTTGCKALELGTANDFFAISWTPTQSTKLCLFNNAKCNSKGYVSIVEQETECADENAFRFFRVVGKDAKCFT
jgi:hypothetical protein